MFPTLNGRTFDVPSAAISSLSVVRVDSSLLCAQPLLFEPMVWPNRCIVTRCYFKYILLSIWSPGVATRLNLSQAAQWSRLEPDATAMLKTPMVMGRCYDAMLKNVMATERFYDTMLKNVMATERDLLASHRNIAPSSSRLAQNAMVLVGHRIAVRCGGGRPLWRSNPSSARDVPLMCRSRAVWRWTPVVEKRPFKCRRCAVDVPLID